MPRNLSLSIHYGKGKTMDDKSMLQRAIAHFVTACHYSDGRIAQILHVGRSTIQFIRNDQLHLPPNFSPKDPVEKKNRGAGVKKS